MSDYGTPEEFAERRAARQKAKKKKKNILLVCVCIAAIVSLGNIFFGYDRVKGDKSVEIAQGSSIVSVADTLKKEKVISKKIKFITEAILSGNKGNIKYGKFDFKDGMSYGEVINTLVTEGAKKDTIRLLIPEGYSVENIIDKMSEAGIGDKESINAALSKDYDYEFLKNIPDKGKYRLQGFLFPATYEFYRGTAPEEAIDKMLAEFEKQYKTVATGYDNVYDIITVASIIEREAKIDSERATISGVIKNRLDKGMKLQLCATVLYEITDGKYDKQKVYYKDLKTDSPYNTYMYEGLPPGPIANPGIKSIEAAMNPEKHDYLYYHTNEEKNDGSHIFTKTYEEHEETLAN